MKYTVTILALAAIVTGTSHAAITGKSSGFMDKRQLAAWRAEAASNVAVTKQDAPAFFTGRPYLASTHTYEFKFRSYDPKMARWTSEDPSGFPDGSNQSSYAPSPTYDLDVAGLLKWSTLTDTGKSGTANGITWDLWTVQTNDGAFVIDLQKYVSGGAAGTDYTYNCHGYTFGNSLYWINDGIENILKGDGYKEITGADKTGARVGYWPAGATHSVKVTNITNGTVDEVVGKKGAQVGLTTSTPAGQGYAGEIKYYE